MGGEIGFLQWVAIVLAIVIGGIGGLVVLIAWLADSVGDSEGIGCFAIGLALMAVAAVLTAAIVIV